MPQVTLFLSAVSNEFRSYREVLQKVLTRHNVAIKTQFAALFYVKGQLAEAITKGQQALEIFTDILGVMHPNTKVAQEELQILRNELRSRKLKKYQFLILFILKFCFLYSVSPYSEIAFITPSQPKPNNMQTDTLFYRLFQNWPQQAFTLLGLPFDPNNYQFLSQEIKQTSFRVDGIFKPSSDDPELPVIFAEVQYQPDPKFYDRFFSEMVLYLYRQTTSTRWLAFVIYPDRKTEKPARIAFEPLLDLPQIKRIYLEDFKHRTESGFELVRLVASAPEDTVALVHTFVGNNAKIDSEIIEFIETVLVYKLPKLNREEIKIMLGLDVQLKQTRFYQEIAEEERREGKVEGRLEGERLFLAKLLTKRFGPLPAGIAAKLEQAGIEELEFWGERILEAQTLNQLFE